MTSIKECRDKINSLEKLKKQLEEVISSGETLSSSLVKIGESLETVKIGGKTLDDGYANDCKQFINNTIQKCHSAIKACNDKITKLRREIDRINESEEINKQSSNSNGNGGR